MKESSDAEDRMRFRDLVLQVERFLKYATKGTNPEVLKREASEFERRFDGFGAEFDQSKIHKLRRKLQRIRTGGSMTK